MEEPDAFCGWKRDMKSSMQTFFRVLDVPFVLCATASQSQRPFQVSFGAYVGCECGE